MLEEFVKSEAKFKRSLVQTAVMNWAVIVTLAGGLIAFGAWTTNDATWKQGREKDGIEIHRQLDSLARCTVPPSLTGRLGTILDTVTMSLAVIRADQSSAQREMGQMHSDIQMLVRQNMETHGGAVGMANGTIPIITSFPRGK